MEFNAVEMDVDKFHNRGMDYFDAKEYEKALEMFQKEIECDPEGCIGYWFFANTLREMGKEEEARENYNIALEKAEKMREQGPEMIDREMIEAIRKDLDSLRGKDDSDSA